MPTKSSIIITNYNQGHLIGKAISSAYKQDYDKSSYEIIIVDDGSIDGSVDLIKKYLEQNKISDIQFVTKSNGGTASARNAGVRASSGSIIGFLDADDEYGPQKLSKSVEAIGKYETVGCVYSDYYEVYPTGKIQRIFKPPFDKMGLFDNCIVSTNSFFTKEAWEKVGGLDEQLTYAEDYDFVLRLVVAGFMIRHIPLALFAYHNHGSNKSNTSDMKLWGQEEAGFKTRAMNGIYYV